MVRPYNKNLKPFARELRKNLTDAEKILWSRLRRKQMSGVQFYRQKIIGDYIVDFYCPTARLVIEIDGGQHYGEEGVKADSLREAYMKDCELKVLRFSNMEVIDCLDGVFERIQENL